MQLQNTFSTPTRHSRRRVPLTPLLLVAGVWLQTGLAAWWLSEHLAALEAIPYRAVAAVVLLLLATVQGTLAWRSWRSRHNQPPVTGLQWRMFLRWLSVGFVVCYGGSLLAGVQQGGVYLFSAAMAVWYTVVLLPLVGTSAQLTWAIALLSRRSVRALGWTAYGLLMLPLCTELALRTYAEFFSGPAGASYLVAIQKLPPGSTYANRQVNAQGYCDDEFIAAPRSGVFRVAALGGELVLGEQGQEHFLSRIESGGANLEVYNFALPRSMPSEYAGQVQREVTPYHPQLVLAFLSLGNDLIEVPAPSAFDWQQLHTFRLGLNLLLSDRSEGLLASSNSLAMAGMLVAHQTISDTNSLASKQAEEAYQEYLESTVGQLAMCRTPIDERMHRRWSQLYDDLQRLIATCERADLPLALVLTPSEFQVNTVLRDVLRRRAGYAQEDLDWELPQRRLTNFAQQHQVPLIDLTPHLQIQTGTFARYDHQFSTSGHAVAAEVIGHFVRTRVNMTLADAK